MQGKKTHEQQVRIFERKPDVPDAQELDQALGRNVIPLFTVRGLKLGTANIW